MKESGEDYLEAIVVLEKSITDVRPIDVAKHLSVSKPSVTRAMTILQKLGYITHNPYKKITLTDAGRARGNEVLARHTFLTKFLSEIIGVPSDISEIDACRIEHVVSAETIERLEEFYLNYKELKNKT